MDFNSNFSPELQELISRAEQDKKDQKKEEKDESNRLRPAKKVSL